jgi:hypothetical protein
VVKNQSDGAENNDSTAIAPDNTDEPASKEEPPKRKKRKRDL